MPGICAIKDCERPTRVRDLCKIHYDRERGESRGRRDDTVLRTRARNRATAALLRAHREEFDALLEKYTVEVHQEHERLMQAAKEAGVEIKTVARLRPGPHSEGEGVEARIQGLL